MRVLFITPTFASNPTSGGLLVTAERLAGLQRVGDVQVLCIDTDTASPAGISLTAAGHRRPRTAQGLLRSYLQGLPLSVWRNATPAFLDAADRLAQEPWDLVYCDHWLVWEAAKRVPAKKRVLHLHNAEHVLFSRAARQLAQPAAAVAHLEAARVVKYLERACNEADELHFLSAADQAIVAADCQCAKVPQQVFLPAAEPLTASPTYAGRRLALSVGSLSWEPTRRGLSWFMDEARAHCPSVQLMIIGKGAPVQLTQQLQNDPHCDVQGFVEDLAPWYDQSKVFLAPLIDGSGIKIKVLNALARGIPVITTSVGVEGFPPGYAQCVFVADSPADFAQTVTQTLALPEPLWLAAARAAQAFVKSNFAGAAWTAWCDATSQMENAK